MRGFDIKFQPNSTLKGDDEHIGRIENKPHKKITIAAPWFFPREFALLHEIGHLVWLKYIHGTPLEKQWKTLCKNTKGKVKQNSEEIFAHSYSTTYGHNKIEKHNHSKLIDFIMKLPK
jgi:hypothetical protein